MAQISLHESRDDTVIGTLSDYEHPDYRFVLLADQRVVVEKISGSGFTPTYEVDALGSCDCPGYSYRETCKHVTVARAFRAKWAAEHS